MSELSRLLALKAKAKGTPYVPPEHISEKQRKELQACMMIALKGATAKERREARESHLELLRTMNPELIYDEVLMFNGKKNFRTVQDIIDLCSSGM